MTAGSADVRGAAVTGEGTASVLQRLLARPTRRDAWGVALCTGYQVGVIVVAAMSVGTTTAESTRPQSGTVIELFLHNAGVFAIWLAGALTLGVLPALLATVSSVLSGVTIGTAVALHGAGALAFLGHAVVELPALAIAMWLAVRPVLDLWAARRRRDDASIGGRDLLRGWIPWTAVALVLLAVAAVWESTVLPTW